MNKALVHAFAADGPLAASVGGYQPRREQLEMAEAIHEAIEATGVLVAEAGTGTGKTFAYLVPALLAGGKVILSTGTKTLQDQLFGRDLPAVRKALGSGASAALLKGRANYVCLYRLKRSAGSGLRIWCGVNHRGSVVWSRQSSRCEGAGHARQPVVSPRMAPLRGLSRPQPGIRRAGKAGLSGVHALHQGEGHQRLRTAAVLRVEAAALNRRWPGGGARRD